MKRAVVTGGAGFLGWHLVDSLQADGYQVLIIDSGITSGKSNQALPLKKNVYFIRADVAELTTEDEWQRNLYEVDELYWLASPASPKAYMAHPLETFNASVTGLLGAIETIKRYGLKTRIVFASTSEIYGDPLVHPQVETYFGNVNTLGPRSIYDESKRMGETLLHTFSKNHVIARIFNTYGPGMRPDDGRLVTEVMSSIVEGRAFELFGDGEQTRSMCYYMDTIRGLRLLMAKGQHGEAYNLGSENEQTVNTILDLISKVSDRAVHIQQRPALQNDPLQRRPNTSKIEALGWLPMVGLEGGLKKMWEDDYAKRIK